MSRGDYVYYAMRAQQEDEAVLRASCDAARERHQEMADAYRFRCEMISSLGPVDLSGDSPNGHSTIRRQPMVSANSSALTASPEIAAPPFCRA